MESHGPLTCWVTTSSLLLFWPWEFSRRSALALREFFFFGEHFSTKDEGEDYYLRKDLLRAHEFAYIVILHLPTEGGRYLNILKVPYSVSLSSNSTLPPFVHNRVSDRQRSSARWIPGGFSLMDMCNKDPFRNGINDVMFVALTTNYCKKRVDYGNFSAAESCYNNPLYASSLAENGMNITL